MVRYEEVLSIMMAPMVLTMDTHAPNYLRVNVICQMMPEYAETYGVVEGDGMYVKPEDRLVVWGNEINRRNLHAGAARSCMLVFVTHSRNQK